MISIVVPVYNEEKVLGKEMEGFRLMGKEAEIVFADGGSTDGTREICGRVGKIVKTGKGRARQMNAGADEASGDILFFLHADSRVAAPALEAIGESVKKGAPGGCLTQRIDNGKSIFRVIEKIGNARARARKVFYGDQGIFVDRNVFRRLGGFPEVPIMEDVLFTGRLRETGPVEVLDELIWVSPRRWEAQGVMATALRYSALNVMFHTGVPLERIGRFYADVR